MVVEVVDPESNLLVQFARSQSSISGPPATVCIMPRDDFQASPDLSHIPLL